MAARHRRQKLAQLKHGRPTPSTRHAKAHEQTDEPQPSAGKAKRRSAHQIQAEGGRTKHRLDKFRRGGRSAKRYEDGGGTGSPRPNDPGNEIATANKGRKSTADWIRDEVLGGTRPAYRHGGRQRSKGYDAGGAAPLGGSASSIFNPPTTQDLLTTPKQNYVASLVQKAGRLMAAGAAVLGQSKAYFLCSQEPRALPGPQATGRAVGYGKAVKGMRDEAPSSIGKSTPPKTDIPQQAGQSLRRTGGAKAAERQQSRKAYRLPHEG